MLNRVIILLFFSIATHAQICCQSCLSEEERSSLRIALQEKEKKEHNPYILELYKDIHPDSVVRVYDSRIIHVDSFSFDQKIQNYLKAPHGYELWFYIRNKKGYKVIASCPYNKYDSGYGRLFFPLGDESKAIERINQAANLQTDCILRIMNFPALWFVFKNNQLYLLKGKRLINANDYFRRKYSLTRFKRMVDLIIK